MRVLEAELSKDTKGGRFVPFAVDFRFGGSEKWESEITGCVYQGSAKLFVKVGNAYRPAAFLLGKDLAPVPGVCAAAPADKAA